MCLDKIMFLFDTICRHVVLVKKELLRKDQNIGTTLIHNREEETKNTNNHMKSERQLN